MDQRMEFVLRAVNCGNFRELCREYGISAKTGYKWRDRFIERGLSGLGEESRRPQGHAGALEERVVCEIVRLKEAHRHWGPRKIHALYKRKHGGEETPSESSFKRVLARAGLTEPRRVKKSGQTGGLASGVKAEEPNDVWTVDFKGWWKDREGLRVEPLTVRDEFSRMLLEMRALEDARTESVRLCFERLFEWIAGSDSKRQWSALCERQRLVGIEPVISLVVGVGNQPGGEPAWLSAGQRRS